jgi:hypothetical protein
MFFHVVVAVGIPEVEAILVAKDEVIFSASPRTIYHCYYVKTQIGDSNLRQAEMSSSQIRVI